MRSVLHSWQGKLEKIMRRGSFQIKFYYTSQEKLVQSKHCENFYFLECLLWVLQSQLCPNLEDSSFWTFVCQEEFQTQWHYFCNDLIVCLSHCSKPLLSICKLQWIELFCFLKEDKTHLTLSLCVIINFATHFKTGSPDCTN